MSGPVGSRGVREPSRPGKAGVRRGDAITRVDGREVRSREEFDQRTQDHGEGDRVTLTLRRDGRDEDVHVEAAGFPSARADDLAWELLGFSVGEDDDGLAVKRVRSGSPVARIGLQKGDRVLGLGGAAVQNVTEFRRKVIALRGARTVLLSVGRGPYQYNVNVPLARGS